MEGNESISTEIKQIVSRRLYDARMRLLVKSPFYGNLVLRLKFILAKCGTAATDMKRIMFDPEFVIRLSDFEIDFVLKHEVMHCVLQHCLRGKDRNPHFFNIACDIVVNSNIMAEMGVDKYTINGKEVMHLTPDNREGSLFSAEEVYEMLMNKYGACTRNVNEVLQELKMDYGVNIDNHEIWGVVQHNDSLSDEWNAYLKEAAKVAESKGEYPPCIRTMLEGIERSSKLDWRAILNDFIKEINDHHDFSFIPPDRRFSAGDYIMPSFFEEQGQIVDNLWFLIDTSGSISDRDLTMAYDEIQAAMEQFDSLSGKLSFFDTYVSEPKNFNSIETLKDIEPVGGGGTNFYSIFKYMREHMENNLPTAVIILTDGYAVYPDEESALNVPVLWIIAGTNEHNAPWGMTIHIQ